MRSYLQQYKFWHLIKNSFSIYFGFFLKLVAVVGIFWLPALILPELIFFSYPNKFIPFLFIMLSQILLFFGLFAVVGEISEICLGSSISISKALSRISFRGVGRFLGTVILLVIIIDISLFGPFLLGLFLSTTLTIFKANSWIIISIGTLIGIILGIRIFVKYFFVTQVVIIERKYWLKALKRSSEISKSHFWKVFFYLTFYLLILGIPPALVIEVPPHLIASLGIESTFLDLIAQIISSICAVIIAPLANIFITLFYYSLRIENYDLSKEDIVDIKTYEAV